MLGACGSCHVFLGGGGGLVLSAVYYAGFLVSGVRLWLTQSIQCREYRFAVKVFTCDNLPPPPKYAWLLYTNICA